MVWLTDFHTLPNAFGSRSLNPIPVRDIYHLMNYYQMGKLSQLPIPVFDPFLVVNSSRTRDVCCVSILPNTRHDRLVTTGRRGYFEVKSPLPHLHLPGRTRRTEFDWIVEPDRHNDESGQSKLMVGGFWSEIWCQLNVFSFVVFVMLSVRIVLSYEPAFVARIDWGQHSFDKNIKINLFEPRQ